MITLDQSRALGAYLGARHGSATILTHDSPSAALLLAGLRYVRGLSPVVGAVLPDLSRVSITLPTPVGTVILISPAAVADAVSYAETVAHECTHAHQAAAVGALQSDVDYLGSGELRATREAQAYVVGLWVRYLLTGALPEAENALYALTGPTYHLNPDDVELARGIVTSGVESMAGGAIPPYAVAVDAYHWLCDHTPASILAPGFQVPT